MSDVLHLKGEGGAVFKMALPLHPQIAKRYKAGLLKRVNEDGSPYAEPRAPKQPVKQPPKTAPAGDPAGGG